MVRPSRLRVVVAEDDYLISEEINRSLEKIGFELVGEAATGAEAVELACYAQPDLVIMDIKMPEMDGLEACRCIQDRCPTPVVVLTAHETQDLVAEAALSGVGAYLTKPPDPREIERAATVALARFKDMAEIRRLNAELQKSNRELRQALDRIDALEGFLSVCCYCKKVRDEDDQWVDPDHFINTHTKAAVTHGLCPQCEVGLMEKIDAYEEALGQ
jgi:AmiR/NasT family two-component response regulator